jgi:nucleotide-binding universal stress UspA family protein
MKVLIAYDGSACANDALEDLSRAGLPLHVDAYVVTVAEAWLPEHLPVEDDTEDREVAPVTVTRLQARSGAVRQEARQLAKIAVRRLQDRFPDWSIQTVVHSDSPAYGVLSEADAIDPDLIVVGSHGRSAFGRLILGSVSQKVLSEAHCSVRIARHRPYVDGSPVRIVIGVDGTPDSDAAVDVVASRNWPEGSSIRVIAAHGLVDATIPPLGPPMTPALQEAIGVRWEMLEKVCSDAASRLRDAGLRVTSEVRDGTPVAELLECAREWGADSIFVGARGHRFLERFLLGSVSAAIASRAHNSVEVVRIRPR